LPLALLPGRALNGRARHAPDDKVACIADTLSSQGRSMVSTHCHVIVIGAGIGGLTAALSLQRHGFKVSVYEQASELREFGAGLLVTPNAMHALEFLGVGEVIAATSNVSTSSVIGRSLMMYLPST
jgi:NADPH-dependent 2,4-dienoyl-CoA reductase/sulfur reductase-like enzyme